MDINCGDILDGVTIEAKGREILDKVIAVASGEKSKVGGARLRRQRVRALADRRRDVTSGDRCSKKAAASMIAAGAACQ